MLWSNKDLIRCYFCCCHHFLLNFFFFFPRFLSTRNEPEKKVPGWLKQKHGLLGANMFAVKNWQRNRIFRFSFTDEEKNIYVYIQGFVCAQLTLYQLREREKEKLDYMEYETWYDSWIKPNEKKKIDSGNIELSEKPAFFFFFDNVRLKNIL